MCSHYSRFALYQRTSLTKGDALSLGHEGGLDGGVAVHDGVVHPVAARDRGTVQGGRKYIVL